MDLRAGGLLKKFEPVIEHNIEVLRSELAKGKSPLIAYGEAVPAILDFQLETKAAPSPCQIDFSVRYPYAGQLLLAFAKAPSRAHLEEIRLRVHQLFSQARMGPRQTGKYYRLVPSIALDFSLDAKTGEIVVPLLVKLKPEIERAIAVLLQQFGKETSIKPYDEQLPYLLEDALGAQPGDGPGRVGIKLYFPNDESTLELAFAKVPGQAEFAPLRKQAYELFSKIEIGQ